MKEYILVLDQGSSSSRAFIFDTSGRIIRKFQERIKASYFENGVQYNGEELLRSQMQVLDNALSIIPPGSKIIGMAIAAQRSTTVLWDKKTGVPLCPVLSWQDGRAARIAEKAEISQQKIHHLTGLYKTAYYSAPKIKWCIENYPRVKESLRSKRLLAAPVPSYILWHLSGGKIFFTDPTHAQRTLFYNIRKKRWDKNILTAFKVPGEILPCVMPTLGGWGNIKRGKFTLPVMAVVGDQQAASFGLGIEKKMATINYGTGAFLLVNTGRKMLNIKGFLNSVGPSMKGGMDDFDYFAEITVNACSSLFEWLKRNFSFLRDITEINNMCSKSREKLLLLPAIGGIGAPYWDYSTFTSIAGLTRQTSKEDIVKAALEGIAFSLADPFETITSRGIRISSITAAGGLSEINYLLQFQADITGVKVIKSRNREATAFGTAKLAAINCGININDWKYATLSNVFIPRTKSFQRKKLINLWRNFLKNSKQISAEMRKVLHYNAL